MHITAVEAIAIDIPLSKNFGGSTYSYVPLTVWSARFTTVTTALTAPRSRIW